MTRISHAPMPLPVFPASSPGRPSPVKRCRGRFFAHGEHPLSVFTDTGNVISPLSSSARCRPPGWIPVRAGFPWERRFCLCQCCICFASRCPRKLTMFFTKKAGAPGVFCLVVLCVYRINLWIWVCHTPMPGSAVQSRASRLPAYTDCLHRSMGIIAPNILHSFQDT